jgi:hypothetical protein
MRSVSTRRLLHGSGKALGGIAFFGLCGCGLFKSPATVVHSLYTDCNRAEYPKARALMTESLRQQSDGALTASGLGIRQVCDALTNSGTLADVEITRQVVDGDRALIVTDASFRTGDMHRVQQTRLLRENGLWKVSSPLQSQTPHD